MAWYTELQGLLGSLRDLILCASRDCNTPFEMRISPFFVQCEAPGDGYHSNCLDRAGGWGAGRQDRQDRDDREDRQPSSGADEAQTTISKCESPIGKSTAQFARAADRRRRRGEHGPSAIQHYVYFAARRFAAGGFTAGGRHRAARPPGTKPDNPLIACTVHGVSTILPM